jgi:hypothetical protein
MFICHFQVGDTVTQVGDSNEPVHAAPIEPLASEDLKDSTPTGQPDGVVGADADAQPANAQPADSPSANYIPVSHVDQSRIQEEHPTALQSTDQEDSSAESSDAKAAGLEKVRADTATDETQKVPNLSLSEGRIESSKTVVAPHEPVEKIGDEEATPVTTVEATEPPQEAPSHAERTEDTSLEVTTAPSDHVQKIGGTLAEEKAPSIVEAEATELVQEAPPLEAPSDAIDNTLPETAIAHRDPVETDVATEEETSVAAKAEASEPAQEPHSLAKEAPPDAEKAKDSMSPEIVPQDTVENTGGASTEAAPVAAKAEATEPAHETSLLVEGTPSDAKKAKDNTSPETIIAPHDPVEETGGVSGEDEPPVIATAEVAEPTQEPSFLIKEAPSDAKKTEDSKTPEATVVPHNPEEEIHGGSTEEPSAPAKTEATQPAQESPLPVEETPSEAEKAKDSTSPETTIVPHDPVEIAGVSTEEETTVIANAAAAESAQEPSLSVKETQSDASHDPVKKISDASTEEEVPVVAKAEVTGPAQKQPLPDTEPPSDAIKDNTSQETGAPHHDTVEKTDNALTEEMPIVEKAEAAEPAQDLPPPDKEALSEAQKDDASPETGVPHHDLVETIGGATTEEEVPSKAEPTEPTEKPLLPEKETLSDEGKAKDSTSLETTILSHDPVEKVGGASAGEVPANAQTTEPVQEPPLTDKETQSGAEKARDTFHDPVEETGGASTKGDSSAVAKAEIPQPKHESSAPEGSSEVVPPSAEKTEEDAQPLPVVPQPVLEPSATAKNIDAEEAAPFSVESEQKQDTVVSSTSSPDGVERSIQAEDVLPTIGSQESTLPDQSPDVKAYISFKNEGDEQKPSLSESAAEIPDAEDGAPLTTESIELPDLVRDAPNTKIETAEHMPLSSSIEENEPLAIEGEDASSKVHVDSVLETQDQNTSHDASGTNETNEMDG